MSTNDRIIELAASQTSQVAALPLNIYSNQVIVENLGDQNVFVALGDSSVVATTTDEIVSPGGSLHIEVSTHTHIAAVTALLKSAVRVSLSA
jgi:hypothetical protein